MPELILGIDLGTTAIKSAVFDYSGQQIASAVVEYELLTPKNNYVELPCEVYVNAIDQSLQKIRGENVYTRDVKIIGFSVQGETLCFLDEKHQPLRNAIVWMDNRAVEQAETLKNHFTNELCYKTTGQVSFEACWPAAKILWVKENEPEVFKSTRHFLLLEDYIIHLLTGRYVAEGSLLTSTLYWDITTKQYWPEMLDFLGVDKNYLPEVMESGRLVGTILPEMANLLQVSPDAKICTGCLDQVAGAIGVGNITPGIFSENIGAALAICVPTETLTYDPNRLMPVHYFGIPDTYMMHTFTTGGMCLRWFRDAFAQMEINIEKSTGIDSYYLLDKMAENIPAGSDGLLVLPHLQGSMAPDVNLNAKGVFYGITLMHTKAHFVRAIMESLGYVICRNIEAISSMGIEIKELRSLGGGSKSDSWNQMISDITGKELVLTQSSQDVACLGAAILAGVATGVFSSIQDACQSMVKIKKVYSPNLSHHAFYKAQYQKYKKLFNDMQEMYAL
jgi:sugar (pentulose or hexulose) kinase